jgi:uncharacterized protein (DUF58 family)
MTAQAIVAVVLIVLGTVLDVPIAIILGIIALLLELARLVWSRRRLSLVDYRRTLGSTRIGWGDDTTLDIEVWNRQRLPLAWLRADDAADRGVVVRERPLADTDDGLALRNVWTLAPFERVRRRFRLTAARRGVYELGPVELSMGDLFARRAASEERAVVDRFLVRPRVVAMGSLRRQDVWGGVDRAARGLTEDPARFAGLRDYAPGDPVRRIHARASARLGRPVVKRFEPSRDREVVLALDVQTAPAAGWHLSFDDEAVESLVVVAASAARALARDGASFGLAAAAYSGAARRFAIVPTSPAPGQLQRVLDMLARLSSAPSAPFEALLTLLSRSVRPGATVVVISTRDPRLFGRPLRALTLRGCRVLVLAAGEHAGVQVEAARAIGVAAQAVRLDGPWRTAERVVMAG